jgi:hypothetical protein
MAAMEGTGNHDAVVSAGSAVAQDAGTQQQNGQDGQVQPQQQQAQVGGWSMIKTLLIRVFIIYMISSLFRRGTQPQTPTGSGADVPASTGAINTFHKDMLMDMYVYITETPTFNDFNNKDALFWLEEELQYGDWLGGPNGDGTFEKNGQIPISEKVQNNGSLYIHVFFVRAGNSPDPTDHERYSRLHTVYKSRQLTKYKKRRFHMMKNLLTGTSEVQADLIREQNESSFEILSHWHPNLTVNMIDDHTRWVRGMVPSPLDEFIDFVPDGMAYYPIVYFNDYWNLNQDYMPINSTTKVLNLTLTFGPLSMFRWQMYAAQGMKSRWYSVLGEDFMENSDEDQDSLKQAFLDTNPYLLGITVIVSIVHSVFEFLAFKNDIQFWRNRKTLEGLSVRSVFFNVFQSLIVLLYIMDNETNFIVKVSIFIGLGIEIWKIQKVVDIKINRENKWFGVLPRIQIQDKSTYTESHTKEYDQLAFKYLSWLLYPLLVCYAVYSVIYLEHRGWYSWVLSMLYGFLLTFGFITMTPQLFINYKLKSVAHLPWRMLTYKALNTFIDDLFAFVIKMPMLYRLGCFRDDIIFCIYVYQRWIYRVDPKRVNEFGTSGEMLDQSQPAVDQNGTVQHAIEGAATSTDTSGAGTETETASAAKKTPSPQSRRVKSKAAKKID